MKITINIPMTTTSATIEGNTEEIHAIVSMLVNNAKPLTKISTNFKPVVDKKTVLPALSQDSNFTHKSAMAFVASIYAYSSNPNTSNGRSRYIAETLADAKPHTIASLAKKSNSSVQRIRKVIAYLRKNGATIVINDHPADRMNHTITLASIPKGTFQPRLRKDAGVPRDSVKTASDINVSNVLTGKRI